MKFNIFNIFNISLYVLLINIIVINNTNSFPILNSLFEESCNNLIYKKTDTLIIDYSIIPIINNTQYDINNNKETLKTLNNDNNNKIYESKYNKRVNIRVNNKKVNNRKGNTNINTDNVTNTKNKTKITENTIYNGVITLKYKTFSHCIYKCNFITITNHSNYSYVKSFINNNYYIGASLRGNCSKYGCTLNKGFCTSIVFRDEL